MDCFNITAQGRNLYMEVEGFRNQFYLPNPKLDLEKKRPYIFLGTTTLHAHKREEYSACARRFLYNHHLFKREPFFYFPTELVVLEKNETATPWKVFKATLHHMHLEEHLWGRTAEVIALFVGAFFAGLIWVALAMHGLPLPALAASAGVLLALSWQLSKRVDEHYLAFVRVHEAMYRSFRDQYIVLQKIEMRPTLGKSFPTASLRNLKEEKDAWLEPVSWNSLNSAEIAATTTLIADGYALQIESLLQWILTQELGPHAFFMHPCTQSEMSPEAHESVLEHLSLFLLLPSEKLLTCWEEVTSEERFAKFEQIMAFPA